MGILPDQADRGAQVLHGVDRAGHTPPVEGPVDGPGPVGRPDAGVVTVADGLGQRETAPPSVRRRRAVSRRRPFTSSSPAAVESSCPLAVNETDPTMDAIQVKKQTKPVSNRTPPVREWVSRVPPDRKTGPEKVSRHE
ncbi:hypothetical protein GCM10010347_22120 [Streptomyces cirratus]|uniref:Uncharacterized protein n=1 Tax=Streptomyces cirratus TaxID=68187 RepID=A0ABQ3EUI1_9ACTN|nr:hypothetical protein GCM10010347_22120 [Streptomyces cirratus]